MSDSAVVAQLKTEAEGADTPTACGQTWRITKKLVALSQLSAAAATAEAAAVETAAAPKPTALTQRTCKRGMEIRVADESTTRKKFDHVGVSWGDEKRRQCGSVGKVIRVDDDNTAEVRFGSREVRHICCPSSV